MAGETHLGKVTVYRFRVYNIQSDESRLSRRWGTLQGIRSVGGREEPDTGVEVDETAVGGEIFGLTSRDFDPHANA